MKRMRRLTGLFLLLLPIAAGAQTVVLGEFAESSTIYVPFNTYNSNGASVTVTGLATTDIEIYKDGSVTQRSSDNGYALLDTDGIDFDGTTGLHGFSIDLSDNTDAGFYAKGSQYWLNVNAITVDGQTVNFTYYFRIIDSDYYNLIDGTTEILTSRQAGNPLKTTIDAVTNQTSMSLAAGPTNDDAFNDLKIHIVGGTEECERKIVDYTGTGANFTLDSACDFTVATSDDAYVFNGPSASALQTAQADLDIITGPSGAFLDDDAITNAKIAAGSQLSDFLDAEVLFSGTCDSGTTTTCVDAALTEADDDYWQKGVSIRFTSGTIDSQGGCVHDFSAANNRLTFREAVTQAVSTNTYVLVADPTCAGVIAP